MFPDSHVNHIHVYVYSVLSDGEWRVRFVVTICVIIIRDLERFARYIKPNELVDDARHIINAITLLQIRLISAFVFLSYNTNLSMDV